MAERYRKVVSGELVGQERGESCDVFVCVIADEDIFVLARPKIEVKQEEVAVPVGDDGKFCMQIKMVPDIIGYSRENCKVYDNNEETMKKHKFILLED